jgi:hypothetical protein
VRGEFSTPTRALGQNPGLERKARSKGREGDEVLVFATMRTALLHLLPQHVAEDAALLVECNIAWRLPAPGPRAWAQWAARSVARGMLQRCSGGFAVVLEDHDVFESAVLLEIDECGRARPTTRSRCVSAASGQAAWRGRAFPRSPRARPRRSSCRTCLRPAGSACLQCPARETCWAPRAPSSRGRFSAAAAVGFGTVGQNLGRVSCPRCPDTAGRSPLLHHLAAQKVAGPLGAVRGNDHPTSHNGIFSQLRHY